MSVWQMNVLDLLSFRVGKKSCGRIPMRELAVFCRKMGFLLDAGLSVRAAIPVLKEQTDGLLSGRISDLHSEILRGEQFSAALSGKFPAFLCGYVAIGERTGRLSEVFSTLASYYETQAESDSELRAAMIYPVAVTLLMTAVIVLAVTMVLPGYAQVFDASGVALPPLTEGLLAFSAFLTGNVLVILVAFTIAVALVAVFLRSKAGGGFLAKFKLKIPILRQKINYNFALAMSFLLSSGLGISEAVRLCGGISENIIVRRDFEKISSRVNAGEAFSASLRGVSYVNPLFVELVRVGEDTGTLPKTVKKAAAYFEASYRHSVRRLNKLVEPLITLVLGGILALIMLAIILPTFELATAI